MEVEKVIVVVGTLQPKTPGRPCQCAGCGHAAWLSDTSIDAVKEAELNSKLVELLCIHCFVKLRIEEIKKGRDIAIMDFTKAQQEEIKKYFR